MANYICRVLTGTCARGSALPVDGAQSCGAQATPLQLGEGQPTLSAGSEPHAHGGLQRRGIHRKYGSACNSAWQCLQGYHSSSVLALSCAPRCLEVLGSLRCRARLGAWSPLASHPVLPLSLCQCFRQSSVGFALLRVVGCIRWTHVGSNESKQGVVWYTRVQPGRCARTRSQATAMQERCTSTGTAVASPQRYFAASFVKAQLGKLTRFRPAHCRHA